MFLQVYKIEVLTKNSIFPESCLKPFSNQSSHHIETSQLTCKANELTGCYMMGKLAVKWLRLLSWLWPFKRQHAEKLANGSEPLRKGNVDTECTVKKITPKIKLLQ